MSITDKRIEISATEPALEDSAGATELVVEETEFIPALLQDT